MFADSLDSLHTNPTKINMCSLGSTALEASSEGMDLFDFQVLA